MSGAATHGIVPALEHLAVPVHDLQPHPDNPNEGDVGAISEQLEARGQHRPVVVQESTKRILAGNHLWASAVALGWTHVAAIMVADDDVQALARMVGDNVPGRRSRDDDAKLAAVLGRLHQAGALEGSGHDEDDLGDTLRRLEVPSLAALEERHGEPQPEDFYPTVKVRVPPDVYEGWCALASARGCTEAQLLTQLVAAAVVEGGG